VFDRRPTIFLALACLVGLHACAGSASTEPQLPNDWGKSHGGFRAELIITDQHEQIERDWIEIVSGGGYPVISKIDHVGRGQNVHVLLFFSNCIKIIDGLCPMTVDFSVTKPDGTEYGAIRNQALWSGEPPARDLVYLGGPYVAFQADPGDPNGPYQVTAVIRGAQGSISLKVAEVLSVDGEPNPAE